jgi:hypothetical protein
LHSFIADALGQQPHISLSAHSTNFPSCAIFSHPAKSEGEEPYGSDGVQDAGSAPLHHNQSTTGVINTLDEEAYFGARYQ